MDAYLHRDGILLWLKDDRGADLFVLDPHFSASVFVDLLDTEGRPLSEQLLRSRLSLRLRDAHVRATFSLVERYDIFLHRTRRVLAVTPRRLTDLGRLTRVLQDLDLVLHNADIPVPTRYCDHHQLFPTARVDVILQSPPPRGHTTLPGAISPVISSAFPILSAITSRDDRWSTDYTLPSIKILSLRFAGPGGNPRHGYRHLLETRSWIFGEEHLVGGDAHASRILEASTPAEWSALFTTLLRTEDPDILLTDYGDDVLFPTIFALTNNTVSWDRATAIRRHKPAHSYWTYGKLIYTSGSTEFIGRWHIDTKNSFWMGDMGIDAIFELARVSRMSIQTVARASIGTVLTGMQLAEATRWNALIPAQKMQLEDWKTGDELLTTDKGGLVFQPIVGLHDDVIEFDFASMYPNIMVRKNLSTETICCDCCTPGLAIPELRKWSCLKQRGIIPATLAPLVEKRSRYKEIARSHTESAIRIRAKRRADAHKWLLVCCFGYLGYKNARFGKIEAHEAVTAWGREVLLSAKEIAERRGFRLLHAIVDSVWLQKPGATEEEINALRHEIESATHMPLGYEGRYRWIVYCRSRADEMTGVANRYFGAFENGQSDGDLKIRGIEARRHDTCELVRSAQGAALALLSRAVDTTSYRDATDDVLTILRDATQRLADGDVTPHQLAITTRVSKPAELYRVNTVQAAAIKELAESGYAPSPGDMVQYIITDRECAIPAWKARSLTQSFHEFTYDIAAYTRLLCRAFDSLLHPCGWDEERLYAWVTACCFPRSMIKNPAVQAGSRRNTKKRHVPPERFIQTSLPLVQISPDQPSATVTGVPES